MLCLDFCKKLCTDACIQLARDCQIALSCLSRSGIDMSLVQPFCSVLKAAIASEFWRTRLSTLDFLQALVFNNFILFWKAGEATQKLLLDITKQALTDEQLEVRVKASQVSWFLTVNYISA